MKRILNLGSLQEQLKETPNEVTVNEILVIKDEATGKIKDIQIRGTGGEIESLLLNPPIKS